MKRIAVKYCGGCNPRYDRAAFAAKFFSDFLKLSQVGWDAKEPCLSLIICGCSRGCADHSKMQGEKKTIYSADEYNDLYKYVTDSLQNIEGS